MCIRDRLNDLSEQIAEHDRDAFTAAQTETHSPGEIAWVDKTRLVVQSGKGFLSLEKVQPSGKKEMPAADFLRGYPLKIGQPM